MDANVTRGNLKNLVTDKPAPITVALAQKSDSDGLFKLMDANVTRGNLKNLVTDKPAPITVALAQTAGVPVHVNPESLLRANTEAATNLGFVDMELGPDEVSFIQKKKHNLVQLEPIGNNQPGALAIVDRNPSVNLAQIEPIANNKPGNLAIADRNPSVNLAQIEPIANNKPGNLAITDRNPSVELAQLVPLGSENKPGNLAIVDRNPAGAELTQIEPIANNKPGNLNIVDRNPSINLAQKPPVDDTTVASTQPGDFKIEDHDAVDSTVVQISE